MQLISVVNYNKNQSSLGAPICRWCRALVSFANEKGVSGVQKFLRKGGREPSPLPMKYSRIYLFRNFTSLYLMCLIWANITQQFPILIYFRNCRRPNCRMIQLIQWCETCSKLLKLSPHGPNVRANRPHRLPTCFPQIGFKQPHLRAFDKYKWGQSPLFMI